MLKEDKEQEELEKKFKKNFTCDENTEDNSSGENSQSSVDITICFCDPR